MSTDNFKEQIIDLKSDFYQLKSKDKDILQEYINRLVNDIIDGVNDQNFVYVWDSYERLVTLMEFVIRKSDPVVEITQKYSELEAWENMVVVSMLDYYMDRMEEKRPFEIEKLIATPEKQMRKDIHEKYWFNLRNAILSVQLEFLDFLEEYDKDYEGDDKDVSKDCADSYFQNKSVAELISDLNQIMISTAQNCISDDIELSVGLVRKLYEGIQNKAFMLAKCCTEMMLFRLNELQYYNISKRVGKMNNRLYCMQTQEGAAYRSKIMLRLEQTFDREKGEESYETSKLLYNQGEYAKAIGYCKESALHGNADGAFRYGLMLSEGKGCKRDSLGGLFWFWKAAQMGSSDAMVNLGVNYCMGVGVWQSEVRGLYYFSLGALQHNPSAVYNVGISLEKEAVIKGKIVMGRNYKRASEKMAYSRNAMKFIDKNSQKIMKITADLLGKYEGSI